MPARRIRPALLGLAALAVPFVRTTVATAQPAPGAEQPPPPPPGPVPPPDPAPTVASLAPMAPPEAHASEAPAEDAQATAWTAGYHNGNFFLRDKSDVFRLYVLARVHADWLDQLGPGVTSLPSGSGVEDGFFLRRARIELAGEFFETWQWWVGAEYSTATAIDNAAANMATPTCTVAANSALSCASDRQNPVENPTVKAIPTDVFINYGPTPWTNVQVGQYYLPFTLENRISDNTMPFLERSLAVRNLGAPLQRDIGVMFWGESPEQVVYYAVAVVNGDGPNRPNVDNRYDVSGRFFVRPFVRSDDSASRWAQIGVSARAGSRDPKLVGYDMPTMTTQGGFPFWKPTYKDSLGRTLHIIPADTQWALAADVYMPAGRLDLTGEFIYLHEDTREAVDGFQLSPFTERAGDFSGYGWYAQVAYWVSGDQDIIGPPSYGRPIHVDLTTPQKRPREGVEVLAKVEQLHVTYTGNSRGGTLDPLTPDGDVHADALELGVNYWATRHLRVGVNYSYYLFPDSAPTTATNPGGPVQGPGQRAVAPAQLLAKGVDDSARDGAHDMHEIQVRVGVQF
jgi:phosphate-selective porin